MEELGSLWAYDESMEELKNKLLWATLELESVKMEASEEMEKYKDNIKHLLGLLQIAYQERDEARDQLQRLLNKVAPLNPTFNELSPGHQPDPYSVPAKANSSATESNSSHSPVNSFPDMVSSPDSGSFVFINQPTNSIIDELARGKVLPQKGKLLHAVMEAGPLLQTLLVSGPLPQWRNPPPLKSIGIPHVVSMTGSDPAGISHRPLSIPNGIVSQNPFSLALYQDIACTNPRMCSAAVWNFEGTAGFSYNSSHTLSSGPGSQISLAKRQRSQ